MRARDSYDPKLDGNGARHFGAGLNGTASKSERKDPASGGVERELTDALNSARSAASEAFDLARLEFKRLRVRGRNGLFVSLVGLWLGVALLAATWAGGSMAMSGLAAGLNDLFNSAWIGDLVAPALLFTILGGGLLCGWRTLDRRRARQLRESHKTADNSTPAVKSTSGEAS